MKYKNNNNNNNTLNTWNKYYFSHGISSEIVFSFHMVFVLYVGIPACFLHNKNFAFKCKDYENYVFL